MLQVLILAMAVSFGIKSWIEGGVICAVIVLNIVVGFFQEYAAEKTMESLHSLSSPTGTVSRGGQTFAVPSAEIVPGDMIELRTGDTVPADIRWVKIHETLEVIYSVPRILLTITVWLKQSTLKLTRLSSPASLCLSRRNATRSSKKTPALETVSILLTAQALSPVVVLVEWL
jgi:hypothetical protein